MCNRAQQRAPQPQQRGALRAFVNVVTGTTRAFTRVENTRLLTIGSPCKTRQLGVVALPRRRWAFQKGDSRLRGTLGFENFRTIISRRLLLVPGRTRLRAGVARRPNFEQLIFSVDHGVDIVWSEFNAVAVRDRVGGTGFDAIAAKYAARVVDVVGLGIALAGGY